MYVTIHATCKDQLGRHYDRRVYDGYGVRRSIRALDESTRHPVGAPISERWTVVAKLRKNRFSQISQTIGGSPSKTLNHLMVIATEELGI